jgi:ABC-2 type transport system ATP-binding protein
MTAAPAVRANGLTKLFDEHSGVRDLHLEVPTGTILGLIGPSGCGKTTTVRLLAGLLTPTEGTAEVFGRPATELRRDDRARIGYLPQVPALFDDLTLWENLSFHASMYALPLRRRHYLRQLLAWVELDGDRKKSVRQASGGMRRRLTLAAAFVHDPDLVFLDEPTAGIDPILREKFWNEFRSLAGEGRTLVVTTQYVGEAAHCDAVGLLSDGELVRVDTPDNLRRAAYGGEVVEITFARPPSDHELSRLSNLPFVSGAAERHRHDAVRLVVEDADAALPEVRTALETTDTEPLEICEHVVDHDEAFVRMVRQHRDRTSTDQDVRDPTDVGGPR